MEGVSVQCDAHRTGARECGSPDGAGPCIDQRAADIPPTWPGAIFLGGSRASVEGR